jgi:hypothetical protein
MFGYLIGKFSKYIFDNIPKEKKNYYKIEFTLKKY